MKTKSNVNANNRFLCKRKKFHLFVNFRNIYNTVIHHIYSSRHTDVLRHNTDETTKREISLVIGGINSNVKFMCSYSYFLLYKAVTAE